MSVAILGAGLMGTAIAAAHLRKGLDVLLFDTAEPVLEQAPQRVHDELRIQDTVFAPDKLRCVNQIADIGSCRIVIETITEKLKAKQKLYKLIAQNCGTDTLLFSNTSTISITKLADVLTEINPDLQRRFCGFHFFHPVRQRSLLEIIPGKATATATIETAKQHAAAIDKLPIVVGDAPGFLVNRILNPYLASALSLLERGVAMERIERLATSFGMAMGPFRIMDEIGLDVVLHAGWVLYKAFPDRSVQSPALLKLVERGHLGRKTGRGFMEYSSATAWESEPIKRESINNQASKRQPIDFVNNTQNDIENNKIGDAEIIDALFKPMYEEALRCFSDGIIADLADADLASVEALGFPKSKGGIVRWGIGTKIELDRE